MAKVSFHDAEKAVDQAVIKVFESLGGGKALLRSSGIVFI